MKNNIGFTKTITIIGTVVIWLPIMLTVVTGVFGTIASRMLRIDYLMPAELFPVALVGGFLLFWAAKRAQFYKWPIICSLTAMIGFLISSQFIAIVTGLASGEHEPTGWRIILVLSLLALYVLSNFMLGIMGIRLFRKL